MQVALIALSTAVLLTGPQPGPTTAAPPQWYTAERCLITLIDEAEVPAEEAGKLKELLVHEGQEVSEDELLGRIDDEMEVKAREVAEWRFESAKKEAENLVNVEYAQAGKDVVDQELRQAQEAYRAFRGAVTPAEMERLRLSCEEARLRVKQAAHEQDIKGYERSIRGAERDVADLQIRRRKILAPIDGIVRERYVHVGEWLRPGDPVLKLIRMDRLRIKGTIQDETIPPFQVDQAEVEVTVVLGALGEQTFSGKIVFVSPVVTIGGEYEVWAEVINRKEVIGGVETGHYLLRPGLVGAMKIKLKSRPASRMTTRAGNGSDGRLVRLPAGP